MGRHHIEMVGRKFSQLTVLGRHMSAGNKIRWECTCECGGRVIVHGGDLRSGHTKSCGCWRDKDESVLVAEPFPISEVEAAYIAGFFDGEGCVGIKRPSRKRNLHCPYATISQVRAEVLHRIKSLVGGHICFNKGGGKNGIWCWQSSGIKHTARFLKTIEQHLIVKKAEAQVVLEAFRVVTNVKRLGTPAQVIQLREAARVRVMGMR